MQKFSTVFEKHIRNNGGKVGLSVLLIASLLALTGAAYLSHNTAEAAAIYSASDTLSDSAPNATSDHTIVFTTPTGVAAGETITVTIPSGFATTSGLDFQDMDLSGSSAGEQTLANTASGATWGATTTSAGATTTVTFTSGSGTFSTDETITIEIGDNATAGATGDSWFRNPTKSSATGTADIYTISIGGSMSDSGDMLVAVIEGVTVSVTIDESLAFSISSETNANCDGTFGTLGGPDTTTTTIPFGTVSSPNTFFHACQNLSVSTNASSGYVMTGETNTSLKTSGGVLIDSGTCDGTCNEST